MRFVSWVLSASLFLGAGLLIGCGESGGGTPMKNMKPGTGEDTQKEMPLKGGKAKPFPSEPPEPDAPPPPGSKPK
jgi:hypothetical protein